MEPDEPDGQFLMAVSRGWVPGSMTTSSSKGLAWPKIGVSTPGACVLLCQESCRQNVGGSAHERNLRSIVNKFLYGAGSLQSVTYHVQGQPGMPIAAVKS